MVIDTEDGNPPELATDADRRVTLFRSIERYPELLSFLPARPPDAHECAGCSGTGVIPLRFTNPALRGIVCRCGGSGWLTPDDEATQQKHTPPTD